MTSLIDEAYQMGMHWNYFFSMQTGWDLSRNIAENQLQEHRCRRNF